MEDPGFTVRDRRIQFEQNDPTAAPETEAGTAPPVAEEIVPPPTPEPPVAAPQADATDPAAPAADTAPSPEAAAAPGPEVDMGESPPIDFSAFVFSLAHASLIHLGLEPGPEGTPLPFNLTAARQNIDVLAMVQEKTRGNLSDEEAELTEKLLYTLRMSFVEVSRSGQPG